MNSCLYQGVLRHRRLQPKAHHFVYRLFMAWLDLDELDKLPEAGIRRNMQEVRDAFAWNPGFKEYFAVKANPNPALISILNEYGCGCDCSSYTELMIARSLGITGHDIMFSSNDTPAADFELADKLGAIVNFDDISHIEFFERVAGPIPKTVSCRFNPGGLFQLSNGIMDNPGDSKYGMTTEQLFEAFRMLKAKGAEDFGIHAFLASNTVTNDYYPKLARILFELAVRLEREMLRPVKEISDYVIDTSNIPAAGLKARISDLFLQNDNDAITVHCISFGFKYGLPLESDLVFDVRCLPNPFYVEELREHTGLEAPVRDYVMNCKETEGFKTRFTDMIDYMLPLYIQEGKSQLVIAVGCTGGHHRSVALAQYMHDHLVANGIHATVSHRDITKE